MKADDESLLERKVIVRLACLPDWRLDAVTDPILGEADRERAARFRFEDDRQRFIIGRRLLAETLRELGLDFQEPLEMEYSRAGRPSLKTAPEIQFSLSHSGDWIALALTLKTSVGIDVEADSRPLQTDIIAERIFSEPDLAAFRRVPEPDRKPIFFRAWTAKEAYLKAIGLGLPGGLEEVAVPVSLEDATSPCLFQPNPQAAPWCLQRLPLPAGYTGCLVWDDPAKTVDLRTVLPADRG